MDSHQQNMAHAIRGRRTTRETLVAAGFMPLADGRLRRGPLTATLADDWLMLEPVGVDTLHLPQLSLGSAGLWKPRGAGYVFEAPLSVFAAAADDHAENLLEQFAAWCEATLEGEIPEGWQAPAERDVRGWLPAETLVIHRGVLVRKVEVVCQTGRLAARAVLVDEVPCSLSAARRSWIERRLLFAQRQWRLVRLGFGGAAESVLGDAAPRLRPSIAAEVDLSGCPAGLYGELWPAAVSALCQVGARELLTFCALCDPEVVCEAFESSER